MRERRRREGERRKIIGRVLQVKTSLHLTHLSLLQHMYSNHPQLMQLSIESPAQPLLMIVSPLMTVETDTVILLIWTYS